LGVDRNAIRTLCERHGVTELSLFGSVLRDDFGPDSDVDVLIEYAPMVRASLLDFAALQRELAETIGRRVDLVTKRALKPYLREQILAGREVIYHGQG